MGMSINTNPGAEFSALAAARAAEMMDTAMLRLSSGRRINSAKDDAAGDPSSRADGCRNKWISSVS